MSRVVFEAKPKRYVVELSYPNGQWFQSRHSFRTLFFAKRKARFIQPLAPARVIDTRGDR